MKRTKSIPFNPDMEVALMLPAEQDLDWFLAHPDAVLRLRPAHPGEIDAQEAMHAAGGAERPKAVPEGHQGGLLGVVAAQRVMAPSMPLLGGAWFAVELPMALLYHPDRRGVAEMVMSMFLIYGGTPQQCRAALDRQFLQESP